MATYRFLELVPVSPWNLEKTRPSEKAPKMETPPHDLGDNHKQIVSGIVSGYVPRSHPCFITGMIALIARLAFAFTRCVTLVTWFRDILETSPVPTGGGGRRLSPIGGGVHRDSTRLMTFGGLLKCVSGRITEVDLANVYMATAR